MSSECVIGVDLGGSRLRAALVGRDLGVRRRSVPAAVAGEGSELLAAAVREVSGLAAGESEPVAAVGVGLSSGGDEAAGAHVRELLSERLGLPVTVDREANAALRAEAALGAAAGIDDALLVALGEGVGVAALGSGTLLRGAGGAPVAGRSPRVALGEAGEQAARRWPESGLARELARGHGLTAERVTELAHDGDTAAVEVVAEVGRALGAALGGLVGIFGPQVVVVTGDVVGAGELVLGPAREELAATSADDVRVVPAALGAESAMIGAALLAWEDVDRG